MMEIRKELGEIESEIKFSSKNEKQDSKGFV